MVPVIIVEGFFYQKQQCAGILDKVVVNLYQWTGGIKCTGEAGPKYHVSSTQETWKVNVI